MKQSSFILFIIAINAFVIGLTEFISVGLIPMFVQDFSITESIASLAVTFYAFGVIIGAPTLSILTNKMNRKNVLILVMLIFIFGNVIVLTAQSFEILILGRFISAFAHGLFMTAASNIAAGVVPVERQSSAIAIMFTGLTVATIFGVPFGTLLASFFSWEATFLLITCLGILILALNIIFIPNTIASPHNSSLKQQLSALKSPKITIVFLITSLAYGSTFIIYTFIAPLLNNVGVNQNMITIILFIYGIMVAFGNTIGGKLTNTKTLTNLQKIIIAQALIFLLIGFVVDFKLLLIATLIIMGLFAFMNVPGLQLTSLNRAKKYTPNAIDLVSALNISAFNLGIAGGSFIGSFLYSNYVSNSLGIVASITAIIAIVIINITKEDTE